MPTLEEVASIREELMPAEETTEEVVEEVITEEATSEPETEETETEETEESVKYFNELPEAMGWDSDQFYNLKLKTDAGEEYTWSEIKDNLQQTKQKEKALAAKEAAILQQAQALQQQTSQVGPVSEAITQAQQNLNTVSAAYNSVFGSLQGLEEAGDTDGLVKAQSELLRLQNLHGQAQAQLSQAQQQHQAVQQQTFAQYRAQQANQLASKVPAFANSNTRTTAINELRDYLLGEGVSPHEVASVTDARSIAMFYKAMQWDRHQQEVQKTAKTIRNGTVKRIIKGKHVDTAPTREKRKQVIERAKTSHREADKRAAYRAIAEDAGLFNLGNS